MRSHEENALIVARFLQNHPHVEKVFYPGLETHPQHELAKRQMDNFSGMIAFRTANPKKVADRMMKQLELIHYAVSLGHHRSLVYLMQTGDLIDSSYRLAGDELEKYRSSAGEGIFRLSIGLEDADDLCDDLAQVL
jgi:methionine-gamma-lyase